MGKQQDKKTANAPDKLFVFGLDEDGKPRGARFPEFNEKVVSAAAQMKLASVHPASPAVTEIGMKLPVGRLYASGKAFVPPIRRDLVGKLKAALETAGDESHVHQPAPPPEKAKAAGTVAAAGLPRTWESIAVGQLVLVEDDDPEFGWWPCLVTKRDDQVLTLRLRDYPDKGTYVRHIAQVGLINPGPE
ncbi:hypothetical protein UNPF46_30865 [Bradyrhizobium sp. UNPF46]|uniref:hypothetical protein n=1 Tax=Bradyrhizobium sp. UNPF46 TaxID=1141168 RepID=UPI00115022BB|nr:hypothetical protein [Bradyrhizobium sp. UNPF46]TQF27462.1 hypothetical protein UNPF46_30865 [Bradyrhizobium sp. UNPF46]